MRASWSKKKLKNNFMRAVKKTFKNWWSISFITEGVFIRISLRIIVKIALLARLFFRVNVSLIKTLCLSPSISFALSVCLSVCLSLFLTLTLSLTLCQYNYVHVDDPKMSFSFVKPCIFCYRLWWAWPNVELDSPSFCSNFSLHFFGWYHRNWKSQDYKELRQNANAG